MLFYLLFSFGSIGFFIWLLIYLFVIHQERGEKLVGWLARLVAWTSKKAEKTAIASSIQGKVDSFVRSMETEVEGILPYGLKIKWIPAETSKEAFIDNNKVVVMLTHHHNKDENISKATLLYMSKAVVPEARPHLDASLSRAINLMMTKKALYSFVESRSSFDYFIKEVLRPQTAEDQNLKDFCESIEITDERGLFTRILLRELIELGRRRAGSTEVGDTVHEANEFVKHLKQIAEKERGQDVNPNFLKNYIRMAVIFIAKPEKINLGYDQYLNAVKRFGIEQSARVIYIFARGGRNIAFAKKIVSLCVARFQVLVKFHDEEFPTKQSDGAVVPGYCVVFYNRKAL